VIIHAPSAGFGFSSKGSATVPVAVCNVSLRTFSKRIRRDAECCTRDARDPRFPRELVRLHPDNHRVREKIRQQLQELPSLLHSDATSRDRNLLLHIGRNRWRLP
jgi:hypothetical protein